MWFSFPARSEIILSMGDTAPRIVHVVPTPFGSTGLFGGGERYPLELARALAATVPCQIVTFGACRSRTAVGGVQVVTLPVRHRWRGHPAHPVPRGLGAALAGASLVHVHHARALPCRMAALWCRLRGRPVVVTDHGLPLHSWDRLLHPLFDRFLPVSAYSARLMAAPPSRTRVIYGGADVERFRPDPSALRRGVLFLGRLIPNKGLDVLLQALPPEVPLLVAGSPGRPTRRQRRYLDLLRRLAAGRDVTFLGPVPDPELPQLLRRVRVLVLPSVARTCDGRRVVAPELLGLVLLEAMASGTPVVASRLGGLPEVVEDGVTGFLVPPGDPVELRDRVRQLVDDPVLAARMGARGRELVRSRFTWRQCADRCLAAYAELGLALAGPGDRP